VCLYVVYLLYTLYKVWEEVK